jgi:hypothetical protein
MKECQILDELVKYLIENVMLSGDIVDIFNRFVISRNIHIKDSDLVVRCFGLIKERESLIAGFANIEKGFI